MDLSQLKQNISINSLKKTSPKVLSSEEQLMKKKIESSIADMFKKSKRSELIK